LDDYPDGGIRLTIGEYTLIGTFEKNVKINTFYGGAPPTHTGNYAVGKWNFEITKVESGTAPDNAEGSTMSGWYSIDTVNSNPPTFVSTKGTGMFHGASMTFVTTVTPVMVLPERVLFTSETAEGDIIFP